MTLFSAYFRGLAFLWISIFWVGSCQIAQAHLISAGNAAITVNPDRGVLLVGVPVSFFKGIDQNQDGLLQPNEIKENRLQMIEQLERAFQLLNISGNTVLESAEGRCNRCHPGVASFTFKGNNSPWHISFLFHVKENKVVDIHECTAMWTLFPELDGGLKLHLDEPDFLLEDADGGMDDPPF